MTTEELIRDLRSEIGAGFTAMDHAADTIEELLAQNRRLREALQLIERTAKHCSDCGAAIDARRALEPKP